MSTSPSISTLNLSRPPTPSSRPSEKQTIHASNIALYQTLTKPHAPSLRPALPPEIVLQILSDPSRWVLQHTAQYPDDTIPSLFIPPPVSNQTPASQTLNFASSYTNPFPAPLVSNDRTGPISILKTLALTPSEGKRIRKVVIEFESKDQGWSNFRDEHGTFENTWSWIDLVLVREKARNRESAEGRRESVEGGKTESSPVVEQRWTLQRNRHAGEGMEKYRFEKDESSELVQAVQEGNVALQLEACALYPGWKCMVQNAKIEIWRVDDLSE